MPRSTRLAAITASLITGAVALGQDNVKVDPKLPEYTATRGVSGNIKSVGSDTMNNLMALWAGRISQATTPTSSIQIEGKGSSTAPPALIGGTATFGPMSREMKATEIDAFEEKFGYKRRRTLRTSIDMLAVYVHKDNPIARDRPDAAADRRDVLQDPQGRFSDVHRHVGRPRPHRRLGRPADQSVRSQQRVGHLRLLQEASRSSRATSRTPSRSSRAAPPSCRASPVTRFGVGYSGIGYKTADVEFVPLAADTSETPVLPSGENASFYPLARFLYLYVNYKPGTRLDPLRAEFIKYAFSREGQEVVVKDGYIPVVSKVAAAELKAIGQR